MNTVTWVFSGILAAIFAYSGAVKATMSRARLIATGQTGIAPFPMPLVRVVAICELLRGRRPLRPLARPTHARVLTPLAAVGLTIVMIGAATSHASLREPKPVAANVTLLASPFVAASRFAALA